LTVVRSMTGFGSAEVLLPAGRIVAEVRSVNSRTLDVRVKLPEALSDLGLWAEHLIRKRIARGRVEANLRLDGPVAVPIEIDRVRAESALEALRELCNRVAPDIVLPLALLGSVPGIFIPKAAAIEELRTAACEALSLALSSLDVAKEREGEATFDDLRLRENLVREAHARVRTRADSLPTLFKQRLAARIARTDVMVDATRLEAEVVLMAERTDVSEELARLAAHLTHFTTAVDAARRRPDNSDEGAGRVGRELDFLLQEMMREVGTLGSKAQDHEVSHDVVRMKVELERMREQVQNVE
jgi:uncharacterized protein (TIGR00255 family)